MSPSSRRLAAARWLAVGVLAVANAGLLAVVSGGLGSLSDVVAPFSGHLIGFGLASSLALLMHARTLAFMGLGIVATFAVHSGLGLVRCCSVPPAELVSAPVSGEPGREVGKALTVLSLNTWGAHGDIDRIEAYLATAPADVVVLSELDAGKHDLLERLAGVYPHRVVCEHEPSCSLAMLSRVPFEGSGAARIADGKPAFVWAKLGSATGASTTIIGTQLYQPGRNPWLHELHMKALAQFVRRIDGALVLAGDLNTTPWSQSFRALKMMTGLVPAGTLTPSWPAWPLALPQVALDHIFVSPELAVAASGIGPAVGSDHLPVWARLERQPLAAYRRQTPRTGSRLAASGLHLRGELF